MGGKIMNELEEKMELLYTNEWMKLRKIRNNAAYEYSYHLDELVDSLNDIFSVKKNLLVMYDTFYKYCKDRFDFVRESEVLV